MANNKIYIKRTSTTGNKPTTGQISNGELAINMTDGIMYSTNGSVVFEIGANVTSKMIGNTTANITGNTTMFRIANSTTSANLTPLTLTIGTSIVNTTVVAAGANVYINTTALYVGNSVMTSTLLTLGGQVNANGGVGTVGQVLTSGGASSNAYWAAAAGGGSVNADAQYLWTNLHTFSANVFVNTATFYVGNSTANVTSNSTVLVVANSTASANHTPLGLVAGISIVNATQVSVGANIYANSTTMFAGNNTVNATITSSLVQVSNSTATSNLTAQGLLAGANVVANTTALRVGNTTLTTTNGVFGGTLAVNGSIGSAGQALISGGAANAFWSTIGNGTVTSVASGNGITGGTITTTGTLYVTEGSGLAVNTTGVHVKANTGIVANTTGTFVNATYIGTLSANNASFLGGVAAASYVQNTDSRTLSGNLVISGTRFTPSSNTVLLGNSTQRWVLSANTGSFSGAVSGITTLATGNTTITGFVNATTTGQFGGNVAISGITTLSANVVLGTTTITANGGVGTAGQVLTSGATGNVYWADGGGGGGGGYYKGGTSSIGTLANQGQNLFRVNANTLNTSTTFVAGENAQATGPISVASGITLTIQTGARVSIV